MTEVACEDDDTCNIDQRSFKAYLSRWMAYTAIVAPWTHDSLDLWLQASAKAAVAQCTGGASNISCGLRWAHSEMNDGSSGVGEQMAAMEIVQSLLYPIVVGPVAKGSGFDSVSDPGVGLDATDVPIAPKSVTRGERVAACIVTLMLLVSTSYGALWMLR